MHDEELKQRLDNIEGMIETLAKFSADQKLLAMRAMVHQQAHLVVLRELAEQAGLQRQVLDQRLGLAFRAALSLYAQQLEAYSHGGDVTAFLEAPIQQDDIVGN